MFWSLGHRNRGCTRRLAANAPKQNAEWPIPSLAGRLRAAAAPGTGATEEKAGVALVLRTPRRIRLRLKTPPCFVPPTKPAQAPALALSAASVGGDLAAAATADRAGERRPWNEVGEATRLGEGLRSPLYEERPRADALASPVGGRSGSRLAAARPASTFARCRSMCRACIIWGSESAGTYRICGLLSTRVSPLASSPKACARAPRGRRGRVAIASHGRRNRCTFQKP
mmetsp:Transcript_159116/g.510313  ORF Transcript_159116/g.510313 Transcript_159116/m.510313 type:complete len:228 (-) Transcript_159116:85-768(-)